MTGRQIINIIINKLEISKADLAEKLEISRPSLYERLDETKVSDMSIGLVAGTVEPMQYKVVIMPCYIPTPENSYEVAPVKEEGKRGKRPPVENKLNNLNLEKILRTK